MTAVDREAISLFGPNTVTVENCTLETQNGFEATINVDTGLGIVRHSTLIATVGSYVEGSAVNTGTVSMTHTVVDAASESDPGTSTCTATTAAGGAFFDTTCP